MPQFLLYKNLFPSPLTTRGSLRALPTVTGEDHKKPAGGVEAQRQRQVWVVGVEDFMRRFLPGRSNAKSIFALAQLNGIVKYACHKVFKHVCRYVGFSFATVLHEPQMQSFLNTNLSPS